MQVLQVSLDLNMGTDPDPRVFFRIPFPDEDMFLLDNTTVGRSTSSDGLDTDTRGSSETVTCRTSMSGLHNGETHYWSELTHVAPPMTAKRTTIPFTSSAVY